MLTIDGWAMGYSTKPSGHPPQRMLKEVEMPNLINRLKGIRLENGYLSDTETAYLRQHVVPDLLQNDEDIKIIFLVESPHKKEVCSHYPLAGSAGCRMTKHLIVHFNLCEELDTEDQGLPIGTLVNQNKIPWLSIMNVSLVPLQKKAYHNNKTEVQSSKIRTLWCAFEEIKSKLETNQRKDPELRPICEEVYGAIVSDLTHRIGYITSQCQPTFFPFGNVARRSLYRVKQDGEFLEKLCVSDIPLRHPSAWCGRVPYRNLNKDLKSLASEIMNLRRSKI